jgi:trk system potassium uptake protein TrkA
VHSLREGFAEILEVDALETTGILNKPISEINLPSGVILGAVVRGDEVIIPRPDTRIQVNDRVVLLATTAAVKTVEKMFSVRLEFF